MSLKDALSGGISLVGKCHLLSIFAISILLSASNVQGKMCTSLRAFQKSVPALCQESYQARCGWFTLKMCTFYEKIPCTDPTKANMTKVTQYKIVTECCPGYHYDDDRITCIRNETDVSTEIVTISYLIETSTLSQGGINASEVTTQGKVAPAITQSAVETEDDTFEFSHGAFAAIACAGLFIICVTIVIIIHVRKRQIKEEKSVKKESATPVELQKMVQA